MHGVFRSSQDGESENARVIEFAGCAFNFERHFFGDFLCASKDSYPPQAEPLDFKRQEKTLDPCFRRDDEQGRKQRRWMPDDTRHYPAVKET